MENNVKSFLEKIQELKDKKIRVLVPSLGNEIECSSLTFKQQKDLISTVAEGSVGALKFQKIINDTIIANTGNNELKITDKLPVIVKLRMDAIGNTVKFDQTEIDLSPVLEKLCKIKTKQTKTIKGVVSIDLEVPTLVEENKVIQAIIESLKKDGDSEFGKSVGNIYTYEIVKYVKCVKFDGQELVFSDVPTKDRYKIVENLPLSINKEIVAFIQSVKNKETEALKVSVDGEERVVEIDVGFFDS